MDKYRLRSTMAHRTGQSCTTHRWAVVAALILTSCGHAANEASHAEATRAPVAGPVSASFTAHDSEKDGALARVLAIHGGTGPWAVAGYRMGEYALGRLGLSRLTFDIEVVHHSPKEVQYSCIADGAAAATGASLGRLTLTLVPAPVAEVATTYRRPSTGATVTLRPAKSFANRYQNVPREHLAMAGREVLALPDADIFEVVGEAR